MLTHSVCSSILLSTQSVITAAPLICLAASVACVYVSRNGWVRKIGERTEVDNCGPGVAQRPEDYHTQHRQLKWFALRVTRLGRVDA